MNRADAEMVGFAAAQADGGCSHCIWQVLEYLNAKQDQWTFAYHGDVEIYPRAEKAVREDGSLADGSGWS